MEQKREGKFTLRIFSRKDVCVEPVTETFTTVRHQPYSACVRPLLLRQLLDHDQGLKVCHPSKAFVKARVSLLLLHRAIESRAVHRLSSLYCRSTCTGRGIVHPTGTRLEVHFGWWMKTKALRTTPSGVKIRSTSSTYQQGVRRSGKGTWQPDVST